MARFCKGRPVSPDALPDCCTFAYAKGWADGRAGFDLPPLDASPGLCGGVVTPTPYDPEKIEANRLAEEAAIAEDKQTLTPVMEKPVEGDTRAPKRPDCARCGLPDSWFHLFHPTRCPASDEILGY